MYRVFPSNISCFWAFRRDQQRRKWGYLNPWTVKTNPPIPGTMFSLSPLSHPNFSVKPERTTYTLQIRYLMHYQSRLWNSFRQSCYDSHNKMNCSELFFSSNFYIKFCDSIGEVMHPCTNLSVCVTPGIEATLWRLAWRKELRFSIMIWSF
jgi:hypothetical protein